MSLPLGSFGGAARLATPWALLAVVLVLAVVVVAARRERGDGGLLFSSLALLPTSGASWRVRLRWVLLPIRVAALLLIVGALARPQAASAAFSSDNEGIDIALLLDTSSSMSARDFGGSSRIDGAKRVMRSFVGGLKNDRVAVVIFSGEGLELSPLTLDYTATDRIIEPIQAGRLLRDGTAIGVGIASAINALRDSAAKSKVVVLFTDGENNLGDISPLDAAELAKLLGIRVYSIGAVGGTTVEVDERSLAELSERTGGQYFRATDERALATIYDRIQRLEKTRVGRRQPSEYQDIYLLLVLPAAALLVLEFVLAATAFRRTP
ncbi:MAG: VWA domain-containing protein [Chloroflexi bacterium]|nr:VWA domain-containing protein [Chloroflexota bacterium]